MDVPNKNKQRLGLIRQIIASIVISIPYLIAGTSIGWVSPVLYKMKTTGEPMNLTTTDGSLMVSMYYLGNLVMPIPSGLLSDFRGRRTCLLILLWLPLASWTLKYFAKIPSMLHVARFLAGSWAGVVITVIPLYLGEIAEPKCRGLLLALLTILINVGALSALIVGPRVSYWTLAIVFGVIPIVSFITLVFVPESPYWLIYKNLDQKAANSLSWYRGCRNITEVEEELQRITLAVEEESRKPRSFCTIYKYKGFRKAVITVELLSIFQRLSGASAIVGFASITLPNVNIGVLSPNDCIIVIGIVWLLSVMMVPLLIDKLGRVPLLMFSSIGCGLSMLIGSVWFFCHRSTTELVHSWIPFAMYIMYGTFFNVGLGPVVTTLQGEMFPAHLKALASGVTAMVLAAVSALVVGVYLIVAENFGMYVNFIFYMFMCAGCAVFVRTYVIETKGKSLHQIQHELQGGGAQIQISE